MKKSEKSTLVKGTEKALLSIADLFSIILCTGDIYEVKVPKKLIK